MTCETDSAAQRRLQGNGGEHAVGAARQLGQYAPGVLGVCRFAIQRGPHGDRGVRAQDGRCGQAPACLAQHGGIELEGGHALDVVGRGLAWQGCLDGLGILRRIALHIGQQQGVAHAQLVEQLAAPGALRGEVDQFGHAWILTKIRLLR